jgi:hypothetical protein
VGHGEVGGCWHLRLLEVIKGCFEEILEINIGQNL